MGLPTVASMNVKGGTGKTLDAINIAIELSRRGYRVALLDVDIDSANLPSVLGLRQRIGLDDKRRFVPVPWAYKEHVIKVVSVGLFDADGIVTLYKRGEENRQIINDLMRYTDWTGVDIVIVDLPAGASDELRSTIEVAGANLLGAIITSLPVTYDDCVRCIDICTRNGIRIFGLIENMDGATTMDGKRIVVEGEGREFRPFGVPDDGVSISGLLRERGIKHLGGVPLVEGMHIRIRAGDPALPEHAMGAVKAATDEIEKALKKALVTNTGVRTQ